jgi:hypothetical protein
VVLDAVYVLILPVEVSNDVNLKLVLDVKLLILPVLVSKSEILGSKLAV